jgi:hypothetical protein
LLSGDGVDVHETKSRVAVALVESIFRRARYRVCPREMATVGRSLRDDFAPKFEASRTTEDGVVRDFLVDVAYRPFLGPFIDLENQRRQASIFALARRQWPNLRSVVVTDHPEPGRSCFQAVQLDERTAGPRLSGVDLIAAAELEIFAQNVADHEELLLRIFALLSTERRRPATQG